MRTALSIAGSDPTGGAGLQADLRVFQAHGVHGSGVVTALTVQDTRRVHQVIPVLPSIVLDQLRVLLDDFSPDAVKIGMLGSDDVKRSVEVGLDALPPNIPIVIDPILNASDGTPLLERQAWKGLKGLFERCTLATPNLAEAELLTDMKLESRADCERAAEVLLFDFGCGAVLIKGGHRIGKPDDLLALKDSGSARFEWLAGHWIDSGRVHGTGCALASAVTAQLARGQPLDKAVNHARQWLIAAIDDAQTVGAGASLLVTRNFVP